MKGLTIHERAVLEVVGSSNLRFEQIQQRSGLIQEMLFKIVQGLIIKGLLKNQDGGFTISNNISPDMLETMNGKRARSLESIEFIENVIQKGSTEDFKYQRFALTKSEEKIFKAMLYNIEGFLKDSHLKNSKVIPLKDHKIIFWGLGEVKDMMKLLTEGDK